jgi:hypothetical protein
MHAKVTIAVAWDQKAAVKNVGEFYQTKPANRVTNAQSVGLPTVAFAAYAAFQHAVAEPARNLVTDLPALFARLTELVLRRDLWEAAQNASLEKARAFALPVLLETSYEPMRRAAIDRCGCAAGPPGRGTSSQAEAWSEERRD